VPLTFNTTVPAGLPSSGQYRIRVQKILPGAIVDGTPNTTNLQFGLIITANYPNPIGPYCVGDQISVPYVLNCDAPSGNIFTLQLSNANGVYDPQSPTIIASVNATGTGSINGNFPNVPTGNGYRMRIVSSNPSNPSFASESSNQSLPFRISSGTLATMKANGSTYCPGEVLNLNYAVNANEGIFAGNVYSIELSNNNYTSHTTLGTLASTAKSGSIQVAIPTNLIPDPNYPNYEIRVRASNNSLDGCEYGLYTIPAASTATLGATNSPICAGSNATFTVSGTNGATLTYTLTGLVDNQTLLLNGSNQTITANNAPTDVTLTLVSVSKDNCDITLGATSTVTVNPTPNAVATPSTQTICSAAAITPIVLSGNVSGTTYNWTRDNSGTVTGIVANGSGNISGSLTNTTNAPITVSFTITPTANNCPGTPITATVLVNPTPNAVATPSSQTICSATAINTIVFSGNVSGTTYNWTRDNTMSVTGIADSGSGNISGTLTNTTTAPITVSFTITPTANNCPGTPITATVLVNPTPNAVATPASQTICSATAINTIALSGNVSGTTYNWTRDNSGTVTGIASNGSGNISGSLTNTTNTPITVTFTITPTAGNCPGTPITVTVVVKPLPTSSLTASKVDVCPNTEVTLNPNCSIPTSTVNWNPGAPTVTPNAATLPYIYKASCTADGCTGNESSVEVRTHRILVDMKDLDVGTLPLPIVRPVIDNMAPTNLIEAPVFPRRWTFIANGCDVSESAVFKLSGPVNFNSIDNAPTYAMFANDEGGFYSLGHPNYGNGGNFPNGTYTLTVDLRGKDGVGGPFPKNRVATGTLLATRTLQFTVVEPQSVRAGIAELSTLSSRRDLNPLSFAEIAPNPVSSEMRLQVNNTKGQNVNVSLLDASGRALLQHSFVPESNQHQEEFEVSNLSNGMYFLKVNTGDKQATLKVVKVE
jgi:hypothetical protein